MSADAPEPPPPPEIPETPENDSSQGEDEPGHTTMEDIDDADSSSSGPVGDEANNDASDGPQEPVNGNGETPNPGADADGSDGPEDPDEPVDNGSSGHDGTRHAAAEDMDAVDDADNDVRDGGAGSDPLQFEGPLSASADNGAAIGPDPSVPESEGKRSAESNGTDEESALTPKTAVDEELAVPEKDEEATRRESDEDVTGKSPEEPNGSHGDTERPTDRPEPTHTSAAGQDDADSGPADAGGPDGDPDPLEATEPEPASAEGSGSGTSPADARQPADARDAATEQTGGASEPEAEQWDADADFETVPAEAREGDAEQADGAPEPTDAEESDAPKPEVERPDVGAPESVDAADADSETGPAIAQDAGAEQADDAPEPPAGPDLADETRESPADALGSVDEAPEQYSNGALRDGPGYQEEIDDQLGARRLDRSEHDKLRLTRTNELTEAQARDVVEVRDAIKLDEGRMVTKVIDPKMMQAYLDNATKLGKYDFKPGEFRGSIARGCDTADLRSMDQLRDGLALDDGGAGWTPVPPGASEAYQLRFPAPHDMRADPSLGAVGDQGLADHVADMAGQSEGLAWGDPFLGTGYTGGGVPEWIAKPTGFPHHAEIWRMHADGTEEAVGFFDKNEGLWNDYD